MLKISQLHSGDIVLVNDDGLMREGSIVKTDRDENLALINNGIQDFWYPPQDIFPIALNESQLLEFGFEKEKLNDSIKYKKGAFRLLTPLAGNFNKLELWYREDRRNFNVPIAAHELQNLHTAMTKVPLLRH